MGRIPRQTSRKYIVTPLHSKLTCLIISLRFSLQTISTEYSVSICKYYVQYLYPDSYDKDCLENKCNIDITDCILYYGISSMNHFPKTNSLPKSNYVIL